MSIPYLGYILEHILHITTIYSKYSRNIILNQGSGQLDSGVLPAGTVNGKLPADAQNVVRDMIDSMYNTYYLQKGDSKTNSDSSKVVNMQ